MENFKNVAEVRKTIFLTAYSASIAHIASAFSLVEILYVLYAHKILNYDANNPKSNNRDLLILSKGHGSLALYVMLAFSGFFKVEELKTFAKPGSIFGGEPCIPHIPGVEATTGSLGHGLSLGAGMALANKIDNINRKVYVILGDGECQEGTIWEAVMFASNNKLSNLIVIIDSNKIQKMGSLESIVGFNSWKSRFEAFGWESEEVDGHNIEDLDNILRKNNNSGKPKVIIANTIKGKGVSIMENNPKWHWKLPNNRELKVIMEELLISEEEVLKCKKHI